MSDRRVRHVEIGRQGGVRGGVPRRGAHLQGPRSHGRLRGHVRVSLLVSPGGSRACTSKTRTDHRYGDGLVAAAGRVRPRRPAASHTPRQMRDFFRHRRMKPSSSFSACSDLLLRTEGLGSRRSEAEGPTKPQRRPPRPDHLISPLRELAVTWPYGPAAQHPPWFYAHAQHESTSDERSFRSGSRSGWERYTSRTRKHHGI